MDADELPMPPTKPADDLVWSGGNIDRVSVSLRFSGEDLEPDVVSALLGVQPTQAYRKGEAMAGVRVRRITQIGIWKLQGIEDEHTTLEENISRLLDRVSSEPAAWKALASYRKDVFCGLHMNQWNRGCVLSPALMQRLSERGLELNLDIYCIRMEGL